MGEDTFEKIEKVGAPRVLFAPNHYHHLSLPRFRERYPDARVVAAPGALPRLRAKGHEGLATTGDVRLPAALRWLVPDGTKSGEAWLAIDGDGGPTWIVCDAFFNEGARLAGLEGHFLRAMKIAPGLCIGGTFTFLCIEDRDAYRAWVLDAIRREEPRRVLFSHGDVLEEDAAARLEAVVRARLG
jgi:hypothetical protein